MPQRDFRNTNFFADLVARDNYQRGRQAQDDQINAERRQAEYAGMGQLLKGVGAEQERIRAADVRKSGAEGMGNAIDDIGRPGETGDLEQDAASREGYETTRAKMALAKQQQDALLARMLASKDPREMEIKLRRLDQAYQRIANLEAQRNWSHGEKDQDQAHQATTDALRALGLIGDDNRPRFRLKDPSKPFSLDNLVSNEAPEGVIPDTKTTTNKAQDELAEYQGLRPTLERLRDNFGDTTDEDFGQQAGGTLPIAGEKLREYGIPQNRNEMMEWRRNNPSVAKLVGFGDLTPEETAGIERRAKFGASSKDLTSLITLIRSGKSATNQEQAKLDEINGVIRGEEFGRNRETRAAVIQQVFDIYNANLQRMQQRRQMGGLPVQGPVSGPRSPATPQRRGGETGQVVPGPQGGGVVRDSEEHYRLADKLQKENPGMTDQEAYEQALSPKDLVY